MTGSSDGWQPATFDLSAYAGQQVEVSISYVTDPSTGGVGVVVDDTAVLVDGSEVSSEGFETGLGAWSVPGPPAGSPPGGGDFVRSQGLLSGAVTTEDSVLLGFGLEQIGSGAERAALVRRAMQHLLGQFSRGNGNALGHTGRGADCAPRPVSPSWSVQLVSVARC